MPHMLLYISIWTIIIKTQALISFNPKSVIELLFILLFIITINSLCIFILLHLLLI